MYAQSNNDSVLETNNSTTNVQILFPNGGLPAEAFLNNYRRGSFQDSVYGSLPPTPNNRDEAGSKSLFFPTPARQNDNQLFLSPTQGGWQNSTTFSMNGQTQNEQAYPATEPHQSMTPIPYVASWALAESPTQTPRHGMQERSNGVLGFNMQNSMSLQQVNNNKPDAASGEEQPELSMAELHEIGQCRPCAYHGHKEDGCRRGADCTFCHMCGPEMLRMRRKEKAQRMKSEMKLRKQEEKEKTKKSGSERESYLNFNTPTNSTKLSSYAREMESRMLASTYTSGVDSQMLASPFHFQDRNSEMNNPLLRRPYMSGINSQQVGMSQGFEQVLY